MRKLPAKSRSRAFSLIEVLLAVFILGIGLIMVASLFPVGADWTRQSAEDSVSQIMAQNALAVIQTHYGRGGNLYGAGVGLDALPPVVAGSKSSLALLPNLTNTGFVSLNERCFQFGNVKPFPATTPSSCTYFWTALARRSPIDASQSPLTAHTYDVYILVLHKTDISQNFTFPGTNEVTNSRNSSETFFPVLAQTTYAAGTYNSTSGAITGAVPAPGQFGIGSGSGTVFRQVTAFTSGVPSGAVASPPISTTADVNVFYAPPADNVTSGSPLVYVFQTTISQ